MSAKYTEEFLLENLQVFTVSYCWLGKEHPDPHCFHLDTLSRFFEVYESDDAASSANRIAGCFIDWTAMPQEKGNSAGQRDDEVFNEGLRILNLWFAHTETTMIKLDYLPEDQPIDPEIDPPRGKCVPTTGIRAGRTLRHVSRPYLKPRRRPRFDSREAGRSLRWEIWKRFRKDGR